MADWPVARLGDLIEPGRSISYGVVQPGEETPGGIPIVRVTDFHDGRVSTASPLRIRPDIEAKHARTRLRGGELLLTLVGTVGQAAVASAEIAGWNTARAVGVIPVRQDVGARWVQLVLRGHSLREHIDARLNTTVQATLNLRDVSELPIPIPEPRVRASVLAILGALDDKIELNRRTNETLEAMARALFKSWFVDFEPVRAKAEGRAPAGMDAATAALFPSRLVETAEGEVPEGGRRSSIYEVADVIYGAPFSSAEFNSARRGHPLVRIRDLRVQAPDIFTTEDHPKGTMVRAGSIVVGMDGEFRAYLWCGPDAWLNQRCCTFAPKGGHAAAFVRYTIEGPLAAVEETETATTVIHLGKSDIDRFRVVLPDERIVDAFARLVSPIDARIVSAAQEARSLAAVRDALLPRLLSGELRVGQPGKLGEEAAP